MPRTINRPVLALFLAAGFATPALADIYSWNTGAGIWTTATNWAPNGTPFPLDTARIGNLAGIANSTVTLNVNATVTALTVQSGMTLRTNQLKFRTLGLTQITGENLVGSTLYPSTVRVQSNGNYDEFKTDQLTISNGGRLWLNNSVGALIETSAALQTQGSIYGSGIVTLAGTGTVLTNDGLIKVTTGGMSLIASADGRIDLDGGNGTGEVIVDSQDASGLMVVGPGLADSFGGGIHLTSDSRLIMNLTEGWIADSNSVITVEGILDLVARPAARITGASATFAGSISVEGFKGDLIVSCPATLEPSSEVAVGYDDRAAFSFATINGGQYSLSQSAELFFEFPTIHGGTFNTPSTNVLDGSVTFGTSEWDGSVVINGVGRQESHAEVSGPTTITASVFDIDGLGNTATWDINHVLTVNAGRTDSTASNRFHGIMNIPGGTLPKLTVNLPAGDRWIMAGTMSLSGIFGFPEERVAGSPVNIEGALNVATGKVRIAADATFSSLGGGAVVNIPSATSILYLGGDSVVEAGATFTGAGTLQTNALSSLTLEDGASLSTVGLVNQGQFQIDDAAGAASVDRFQNVGTWRVSIGGHIQGSQHDVLIVSGGTASVGGTLDVSLTNTFQPSLNDQFTILTTVGAVTGTFAGNPTTVTPAGTYQWTVLYQPNAVILRVTGFTPAPCYANCDGSGIPPVLNVNDFTCFLNKFAGGSSYANCDGSTSPPVLNVNDFTCFLNRYAAGCP